MSETLAFVPFDIETAGFGIDDPVSVVGFDLEMGARILVNTGERETDGLETTVQARAEYNALLTTHDSEAAMLDAVGAFVADRLRDRDVLLVAYNGGVWNGGFDLPFLRTRHAMLDIEWPFRGLPYADLMPVMTNRFNTTVDGEAQRDLDGVAEVLLDSELGRLDPFAESDAAVEAFQDGAFEDLVMHNVADILRTRELGELAQRYCSKSDFQLKSLTPTICD